MVEVTVRQNPPIYSANIPLLQVDVSVRSGDGADRSIVHVFTGILHLGPAVVTRTLPWSRGVQPVHHSIISDEHRENLNTATIFKIKEHQPPAPIASTSFRKMMKTRDAPGGWWNYRKGNKAPKSVDVIADDLATEQKAQQSMALFSQWIAAAAALAAAGDGGVSDEESNELWQMALRLRLVLLPEEPQYLEPYM